jgi:serine/threonine protein kinase
VINILHYFATDDSFCLVFEAGRCDLFSRIESDGPLSEDEARAVFRGLLIGLAEIHDRGIVHRDIKLENLIVSDRGDVKLADFGFAEVLGPGGKLKGRRGFYRYWAPEVVLGKPHDEKVDVWAMGVCLFACITGRFPFEGRDEYEYTTEVLWGEPQLEKITAGRECMELIGKMLERNPGRRPSVAQLLKEEWFAQP